MKIAVIGSTMMDVVSYTDKIPEAGETRTATDFHTACGGKGANQAIAAAKLGADVLMLTCVGDDMFGRRALENFTQHHVDAKQVRVAAGVPNGVATILVDASSQNRILICNGANDHLTPAVVQEAAPDLEKCGLFVLQLEVPVETVYAAIDFAKKHGIKVLLKPCSCYEKSGYAEGLRVRFLYAQRNRAFDSDRHANRYGSRYQKGSSLAFRQGPEKYHCYHG